MDKRCETCKWWEDRRNQHKQDMAAMEAYWDRVQYGGTPPRVSPQGYCRRYPQPYHKDPQDWCGEWEPKE